MGIPLKTTKYLFMRSGGACAICHCAIVFSDDEKAKGHIAEMAHIYGENDGAKRYSSEMTDTERNGEPNLIVLCPNCHTKIDGFEWEKWPVERLQRTKRDHENWMEERLQEIAATQVSHIEIEAVLSYLQNLTGTFAPENYTLVEIKQKIQKNNLSHSSEVFLNIGFLRDRDVESYIAMHPDPNYANNLREILVNLYNQKVSEGFTGDYLFEELVSQLSPVASEFNKRAAALAVIAYFFRICEIFEK